MQKELISNIFKDDLGKVEKYLELKIKKEIPVGDESKIFNEIFMELKKMVNDVSDDLYSNYVTFLADEISEDEMKVINNYMDLLLHKSNCSINAYHNLIELINNEVEKYKN